MAPGSGLTTGAVVTKGKVYKLLLVELWSTSECSLCHASWNCKEDLFESDSADSNDTEERRWSINVRVPNMKVGTGRKICEEVEEEEEEGMELDAREAREFEEKTRFATSLDEACARTVKPATITEWCKMVEEHPSGESSVAQPTKEDLHQKKRRDILEGREAVEKNTLLAEDAKNTHCLKEQTNRLQALELQEAEHQTDNEKSKKLTSERSSINDTVSHKEGVVKNAR